MNKKAKYFCYALAIISALATAFMGRVVWRMEHEGK